MASLLSKAHGPTAMDHNASSWITLYWGHKISNFNEALIKNVLQYYYIARCLLCIPLYWISFLKHPYKRENQNAIETFLIKSTKDSKKILLQEIIANRKYQSHSKNWWLMTTYNVKLRYCPKNLTKQFSNLND